MSVRDNDIHWKRTNYTYLNTTLVSVRADNTRSLLGVLVDLNTTLVSVRGFDAGVPFFFKQI